MFIECEEYQKGIGRLDNDAKEYSFMVNISIKILNLIGKAMET